MTSSSVPSQPFRVVLVADLVYPRVCKIGYGLRSAGWTVVLLHRDNPTMFVGDISICFDETHCYGTAEEAVGLAFGMKGSLFHVFSVWNFDVAALLIRHKPGRVIFDDWDVIAGMVSDEFADSRYPGQRLLEKYCFENADGVCSRCLEPQYARRHLDYRFRGKPLLLLDSCWDFPDQGAQQPAGGDELHVAYVGSVNVEKRYAKGALMDDFYLDFARDLASSRIHFHIYPNPFRCQNFADDYSEHIDLSLTSPYFHFHAPLSNDRIGAELARYDVGLITDYSPKLHKRTGGYNVLKYYYCGSNKIFDYMDAGLGTIISDYKMMDYFLHRTGVGVFSYLEDVKGKLLSEPGGYWKGLKENARRAKSRYSIKKSAPRLIDYYLSVQDGRNIAPRIRVATGTRHDAVQRTSNMTKTEVAEPSNSPATQSRPIQWCDLEKMPAVRLYAGDIPDHPAYRGMVGLSLNREDANHIRHDITIPFPLQDGSVDSFQAEDVFEHICYDRLPAVIDEIFRVLKPGGLFRLSIPDYGCDVLSKRSYKNALGEIVFDPLGGGTPDDPGHVWFPRLDSVRSLLERTLFATGCGVEFLQHWNMDGTYTAKRIDYEKGHVQRTPDFDPRVREPYRPMSLVVDLTKGGVTRASAPGPAPARDNSQLVKISFVMIVLNGMPFIEHALKAIYDEAHQIVIVEGAVESCMFAANPDGSSTDGTVELIRNFPDPLNKIQLIQGRWPEKCEMQDAALAHVSGNYVWLVDSDEVYRKKDLATIRTLLANNPGVTQVNFIPDNFWKGFDFLFVSPMFFEPAHHYRRLFKFKPGARFTSHRPPTMVWPGCTQSTEEMQLVDGLVTRQMGVIPCHYSYVLDAQVKQKIELYHRYGWGRSWGLDLDRWYHAFYRHWTPANRLELEAQFPIWTGDPGSYSVPFQSEHPEAMAGLIAESRRAGGAPPQGGPARGGASRILTADNASYQYEVFFDINDGCNLKCIMCGGKKSPAEQHVMSVDDFADHIVPLLCGAKQYQFGCSCEPLLAPSFKEAVALLPKAADDGPQGEIVTNGTLLNEANVAAIVDSGAFRKAMISFDGATAEMLESIRRGADYERLIANVSSLVSYAKARGSAIEVEFLFTVMRKNFHQLPDMVRLAAELGVQKIGTHKLHPHDSEGVDEDYLEKVSAAVAEARSLAERHSIAFADPQYVSKSQHELYRLQQRSLKRRCSTASSGRINLMIDCRGTVTSPCSRLGRALGNILVNNIGEIAMGEPFRTMTRLMSSPDQDCLSCYLYTADDTAGEACASPASNVAAPQQPVTHSPDTPVMFHVIEAIRDLRKASATARLFALETGTIRSYYEKHESTKHLSAALGPQGHLISVDCNPESIRISRDICDDAPNVTWVESESVPFLKGSPDLRLSFALLDSANDQQLIMDEFALVVPMMRPDGIVMIDDAGVRTDKTGFDSSEAEKGRAVWHFLESCGARYSVLETPHGHGTQIKIRLDNENERIIKNALRHPARTASGEAGNAPVKKGIKVAGDYEHNDNLTAVNSESEFATSIRELFGRIRPAKIIETGTYWGEGTTRVIAQTLRDAGIADATFYSIECNPENHRRALSNLAALGLLPYVKLLEGLSLPRHMLPKPEEIEERLVRNLEFDDIFVDHQQHNRTALYFNETAFDQVADDLLRGCLSSFDYAPDFVLLDSGGHIGNIEFNYLITLLRAPAVIALDDIFHVKHHKSFLQIQSDPRFQVIRSSKEKFGFCIAQFTP